MIAFILLLLFVPVSYGISEEEVTKSILQHFPLIEETFLKYEASREELSSARGSFDHKLVFKSRNKIEDKYDNQYFEAYLQRQTPYYGLGLVAGHRQGAGTFAPYDGKYATSGAGEMFAGLTFPLLRGFLTDEARFNLELGQIEMSIKKAELELKKNLYVHKGLSLYYKWLYANKKMKIRKDVLKLAEERQSMLQKKFEAGDIERLKLTDNQRSITKRKDELEKTRLEWQETKNQFELYYRDTKGLPVILGSEVLPEEKISSIPVLINESVLPQLNIIEQEINLKKVERDFHKQSKLPGLNVEVLGAKELSSNEPYDPTRLEVAVKFDFPLENRKAKGKTVASEYKYLALLKQRDYTLQSIRQQINFLQEALTTSKLRWEITSDEFRMTSTLADAERKRWQQGASDLYIVGLREQDMAEADIKRWSSWYEFHQYLLDAKLYSGKLITGL